MTRPIRGGSPFRVGRRRPLVIQPGPTRDPRVCCYAKMSIRIREIEISWPGQSCSCPRARDCSLVFGAEFIRVERGSVSFSGECCEISNRSSLHSNIIEEFSFAIFSKASSSKVYRLFRNDRIFYKRFFLLKAFTYTSL